MSKPLPELPLTKTKSVLDLLKDTFRDRRERNSSYSLTSFARDLGISQSLLSRLFSGERPVTLKIAMQITAALDLGESQSKQLILSAVQTASNSERISRKVKAKLEKEFINAGEDRDETLFTTFELERFKAMASWEHLAILNLTQVKGFKSDPDWIAERLGITPQEARECIERLLHLNVLQERNEHIESSEKCLYVKTSQSELAVRSFHQQMIKKASSELMKTSHADFHQRLINGITFPCDLDQIELIKEKINRLQDEILALSVGEKRDDIYQMNVQFFSLSHKNEGRI